MFGDMEVTKKKRSVPEFGFANVNCLVGFDVGILIQNRLTLW